MSSYNNATVVGNLGRDPEVRYTQGGQAVCNFSVATSESWTDKTTNEKKEKTEWHRIVVWGKQGENCGQCLKKGSKALVSGRLQTREYEKDGQKHYSTEIVADRVVFLTPKGEGATADAPASTASSAPNTAPPPAADQADIPF